MSFPAVAVQLNGEKTDVHNMKTSSDSSWTHKCVWKESGLFLSQMGNTAVKYSFRSMSEIVLLQNSSRGTSQDTDKSQDIVFHIFIDIETHMILVYKNVCVNVSFSYTHH